MTIVELRNAVISALHDYLGVPVVLVNPDQPQPEPPYMYYQFVNPYIPARGANIYNEPDAQRREEYAQATISLTACSYDRAGPVGWIFGDDEALALCERARGFFDFCCNQELELGGITPLEIMQMQDRSGWDVDDMVRRWGFDVRLQYLRVDTRPGAAIETVTIKEANN